MINLRDYQQRAVSDIRDAFRAGRRAPILVSPCGSGKTVTFAYIAQHASLRGNKTLILVHRKELLRQSSRTLSDFDVAHGAIAPSMSFNRSPVQVASVATLARRHHLLRWEPDLIIVDEAHHALGKNTWGKVLNAYPNAKILGVTATPERLSGEGLGVDADGFFDHMIIGPSVKDLTRHGYLSPYEVYAPAPPDLSGVHIRAGDYIKAELSAALDRPTITGSAVQHYRRLGHREPAIAFCTSVAHAEHVAEQFRAAGYSAASIDGKLDDKTRSARIADLGNGTLNVLTSCEIISEGTDIPVVSVGIMLRPTESLGMFVQQTGRIGRPFPGKKRGLILDHAGGIYKHGMPDEDREWSLDARRRSQRKEKEATFPVRQCDKCDYVHRPVPACPKCGFVYPVAGREVEYVEGDLEKVNEDIVKARRRREVGRAKSLDALQEIAKERGYNPRWAEFVWKARSRKKNGSVAA